MRIEKIKWEDIMIKGKTVKAMLCLLLALAMVFSIVACANGDSGDTTPPPSGGNDTTTPSDSGDTTTATPADPDAPRPTLTMVNNTQKGADDTNAHWPYQTFLEMQEILNVTIELRTSSEEQDQLMLASGDMPDLFNANRQYYRQLIEGGLILPLDDLVASHGPDLAAQTFKLDFARKFLSSDTGLLYGITSFTGMEAPGFYPAIGFFSRWDLYTQLGFPPIGNPDEILDVIHQMVQLEPETPDGLPTYGLAVFDGWGMWPYTVFPVAPAFNGSIVPNNAYILKPDGTETNAFTDFDADFWQTFRLFNKAHQLGIFDVDSIVQPDSEYANKSTNGQYMIINAVWWMTDYNARMREEHGEDTINGFQLLPMENSWMWANNSRAAGDPSWMWVIGANSEHPEAAMTVINYMNSYDGIRHLMSGTEGDTYEIVDGKPEMKPEYIQGRLEASAMFESRFWLNENLFGFTQATPHPADGHPLNLFITPRAFAVQNTHLDTVYSNHYGAEYPNGVINAMVEAGKMMDYRDHDNEVIAALQPMPDNIQRIDTLINEIISRVAAQAVLAPNDAAFQAIYESAVAEIEAAGLAEATAFWKQNYENAYKEIHG